MFNETLNSTICTQKSFGPVSISLGTRLTSKNDNNNNDIIKKKMKRSISIVLGIYFAPMNYSKVVLVGIICQKLVI